MKVTAIKILKQILIAGVFVVLASLTTFAQQDEKPRRVPPKDPDKLPKVLAPNDKEKSPREHERLRNDQGKHEKPKKP